MCYCDRPASNPRLVRLCFQLWSFIPYSACLFASLLCCHDRKRHRKDVHTDRKFSSCRKWITIRRSQTRVRYCMEGIIDDFARCSLLLSFCWLNFQIGTIEELAFKAQGHLSRRHNIDLKRIPPAQLGHTQTAAIRVFRECNRLSLT